MHVTEPTLPTSPPVETFYTPTISAELALVPVSEAMTFDSDMGLSATSHILEFLEEQSAESFKDVPSSTVRDRVAIIASGRSVTMIVRPEGVRHYTNNTSRAYVFSGNRGEYQLTTKAPGSGVESMHLEPKDTVIYGYVSRHTGLKSRTGVQSSPKHPLYDTYRSLTDVIERDSARNVGRGVFRFGGRGRA